MLVIFQYMDSRRMSNVFLALLWVFADAAGPQQYGDQSGFSGGRVSSRSTEVEEYLRSMTKIKPQWSDEKILRSARSVYGDDWVPKRIPEHVRHVPGTVSSRPGSAVHSGYRLSTAPGTGWPPADVWRKMHAAITERSLELREHTVERHVRRLVGRRRPARAPTQRPGADYHGWGEPSPGADVTWG